MTVEIYNQGKKDIKKEILGGIFHDQSILK